MCVVCAEPPGVTAEVKPPKNWRTRHIDKPLGARIIELRETRGVDRKTLAARLEISLPQMQHFEEGDSRLSAAQIWQICSILGLEVSEVFVGLPSHVIAKRDLSATETLAKDVWLDGATWVAPVQARPDVLALSKAARRLKPAQVIGVTEMVRGMKPRRD